MGWPSRLVLVRHAESLGNTLSVSERAQLDVATHDYPITERGRDQATKTRNFLKEHYEPFDVRYASYYRRSRETMEVLSDVRYYEDPRLAEAQRGMWHSMTADEVAARYPEEVTRKAREGLYHYRPWGGENWADVELRIHSFLGTLARDCTGLKVLVVVHGHWLILFERLVLRFSIEEALQRYKAAIVENASVTVYQQRNPACGELHDLRDARSRFTRTDYCVPWKV